MSPRLIPVSRARAGPANRIAITRNGRGSSDAIQANTLSLLVRRRGRADGVARRSEISPAAYRFSTTSVRPSTCRPRGTGRPVRSRCSARTTSIPASVSNRRNCAPTRGLKSRSL
jgi:hypothetical protein